MDSQFCQIEGHTNQQYYYLCLQMNCNKIRWLCQSCIVQHYHKHDNQNLNHIMNREQLLCLVSQNKKEIQPLVHQLNENMFLMNEQQMNILLDLFKQSLLCNHEIFSQTQNKQFKTNGQLKQQILPSMAHQLKPVNQLEFNYVKFFDQNLKDQNFFIGSSQISPNEKYLVYSSNKYINIFDVNTRKQNQLQTKINISTIKFSDNSKHLYLGSSNGYVYCYEIFKNFKLFLSSKIHKYCVIEILQISYFQCITSSFNNLKLINMKTCKQYSAFNKNPNLDIEIIDYDRQLFILIALTYDGMIKFFQIPTLKLIFCFKFKNVVSSIQLVQNQQILIRTNNDHQIQLWKIEYLEKTLKLVKTYTSIPPMNKLTVILNIILIFSDQTIQILDIDLNEIKRLVHDVDRIKKYDGNSQLKSINYILITGEKRIQILKRVEQQ